MKIAANENICDMQVFQLFDNVLSKGKFDMVPFYTLSILAVLHIERYYYSKLMHVIPLIKKPESEKEYFILII